MSALPLDNKTCPETGLPITRRSAWTDVPLTAHYSATFALLGDHILLSCPQGAAETQGIPRFFELRERILREVGLWQKPHVEIKSYDLALLPSAASRRQFAEGILHEARRGHLRGFWGFGGHPAIRWIHHLGRFRTVGKAAPIPVDYVPDYRAASLAATMELERLGVIAPSWQVSLQRGWTVTTRRASGRYRLIAPDTILSEVHGEIDAGFILDEIALFGTILDEVGFPTSQPFFQLRDMRDTSVPGAHERQVIIEEMSKLARRRAYGGTVIFGLQGIPLRLLVRAIRGPMPAKLLQAATYAEAIHKISSLRDERRAHDSVGARLRRWLPRRYARKKIEHDVDELLSYTSEINWGDREPLPPPRLTPKDNPLAPIQAAIDILKLDFDRLLQQNAEAQKQLLHAAKLASLGTLTSGLAHELNSPLAAINGYAQRLARSDDPKVRDEAAAILRAAGRLHAIIGQFGPGASRPAGPRRLFDLGASITDDVLPLLDPLLKKHQIAVDLTHPDTPIIIHGNPTEIQGALVNILTNACHALATIPDEASRRIDLHLRETAESVEVICHDTGPGMSEEVRQRAIDPFFTTKNVGEGSGLGLYLAHRFIEDHGGVLQLTESQRGCRVVVRLPTADTQTQRT